MKRFSLLAVVALCFSQSIFGWGAVGHDAVCAIADHNLKPKARRELHKILDGHTIVYYSSWMDYLRNVDGYEATYTWHYANVDEGESYETMRKNPKGDVVTAINDCINTLQQRDICDSLRSTYTKYLIHLVGDLHCPMHAGRATDAGGNRHQIKWFGKSTNLHSLWDSKLIESYHKWHYSEWCEQLDRADRRTRRDICKGSVEDWFAESVEIAKMVYEKTPANGNYSYAYSFEMTPVVEEQITKAGYRLAYLLNKIFG